MLSRASFRSSTLRRSLRQGLLGLALSLAAGACAAGADAPPAADAPVPASAPAGTASRLPDCSRPLTLGLHEHGLLYTSQTGEGIDKDIADEMSRRSGCHLALTMLPRARIWQLIEAGALDFTLSGIANAQRDRFAAFAWYVSNKYYLLVRRDADVRSVADFRRKRGLRVGLIRSFRYGEQANAFVDALEEQERVTYAGSLDPLYTILLDDGIQAMIVEPFDFPVISGAQIQAQTTILEFGDAAVPHGLVMSRKSLSAAQQQAWRDVIQSMRGDGTIRRIFEKYFSADLARQMTQF
ncbi:MAG TPA: transporter substrate-binding domain-containing protein [Burkholderiaceae bacterium]|jgi:polar amino acid transport system substrate-binding protein|nr:transporter substrate-binding domain-containing protein [Burkholderiaceae bacterium]